MRVVHPSVDQLQLLRQPLTPGELALARLLYRELPPKWEIYLQPHLNGLRPDIVLLNPEVGIAVFEVKDWNLDAMTYEIGMTSGDRRALFGRKDGARFLIKDNPVHQVNRYKRHIFELYCPRLATRSGFAAITAGVVLPYADDHRAQALLAPFVDAHSEYQPIAGRDAITRGDLRAILPEAFRSSSKLMSEELAADLRGWLVEPDVSREQREPLLLDSAQRRLTQDAPASRFRRVKGPAGSGKSVVLAARAARLADESKRVLVISFNITLRNYLRDLVVRGVTQPGAMRNVEFTHFHGWARDLCEEVGWEDRWAQLFAALPKPPAHAGVDWHRPDSQETKAAKAQIDEALAALVVNAVVEAGGARYDAILVDEGQDFRPSWWNALRTALNPDGEMLLVADATQDVYGTARAWTDDAMTGAGFSGRWAQLSVSYRLPTEALAAARAFAEQFLPSDTIDLPEPRQGSLPFAPSHLRWVQCTPDKALDACIGEIFELMKHAGKKLANADITLLADSVSMGASIVERLARETGIRVLDTYASANQDRRRQKMGFFKGSEKVKATTLHSFKGWESPLLLVHIAQASDARGLALIYTALTRLKHSEEGSWLTVVCSAPELADYGSSWADDSR